MKKKSIFLLSSIVAFSALVGATFASWAVTDNADPFNLKVSTGSIETDTTTKYVTFYYGESQNVGNVANLTAGTIRKAGVLDLRANTSDGTAINGKLTIAVTDSNGTGLAAKLVVKVYEGDLDATDGVIASDTISSATEKTLTNGTVTISTTSNAAHLYTLTVSLAANVTPKDLTGLENVVANINVDWAHGLADGDVATTTTLYATGFNGDTYVYAWKGAKQNAAWPGVKMEAATRPGYYVAEVSADFDHIIFNDGNEAKSGELVIAEEFTDGKNLYNYNSGGTATIETYQEIVTPDYYLIGNEFGNWDTSGQNAVHLENPDGGVYTTTIITHQANSTFKIYDKVNDLWYGEYGTSSGNFTIGTAGTYTITFNPAPTGDQPYIVCAVANSGN